MRPLVAVLWIAAFHVGCGSDPRPAPRTFVETRPTSAAAPPPPNETTASNVTISADIRSACGISEVEAFFTYDSANVRSQDRGVLKKLADCFTGGPLRGREMRLIGHADPRGDEEYNHVLGQRRADSVKSAVVEAGMTASSIATTSRGEDDASGTEETSWANDRRVDIVLGS